MAYVGRPGGIWRDSRGYWRSWINGRCRSFGRDRRTALRAWLVATKGQAEPFSAPPEFLAELVERWELHHGGDWERWRLRRFVAFMADSACADIDADLLHRYAAWLRRQTYTRGKGKRRVVRTLGLKTVREETLLAGRVLRWGAGRGWVTDVPEIPRLPKPARQPHDLEPSAVSSMLTAPSRRPGRKPLRPMPARARRMFAFALETGCRPSEVCRLKWEDVNLAARIILIPEHKTSHRTAAARSVPLTDAALEVLRELKPGRSFVFLSRLGKPYTPAGLRSILKRRGATPYQLRHTFAQVRSEQLPLDVLAAWMGHSNLETMRFYRDIRDARLREAAADLPGMIP